MVISYDPKSQRIICFLNHFLVVQISQFFTEPSLIILFEVFETTGRIDQL